MWRGRWRPDFKVIVQLFKIGLPNGLENSFFQLGRMLTVSYVALYGVVHITANAVANTVAIGLALIPGNAAILAMITAAGRSADAGEKVLLTQ